MTRPTLTDEQAQALGAMLFLDPETGCVLPKGRQAENVRVLFGEVARSVLRDLVTKALLDALPEMAAELQARSVMCDECGMVRPADRAEYPCPGCGLHAH